MFENNLRIMLGYFSFVKNNVLGFIRKIEKSVHLKIIWKFEKNILKVKKIPPEKNSHLMWRLHDLIRDLLRINNILTNPNRDRKLRHSSILLELIPNLATTWKLKANALVLDMQNYDNFVILRSILIGISQKLLLQND